MNNNRINIFVGNNKNHEQEEDEKSKKERGEESIPRESTLLEEPAKLIYSNPDEINISYVLLEEYSEYSSKIYNSFELEKDLESFSKTIVSQMPTQ